MIEKNISIAIHKALWFQSANMRYIHELISSTDDFFKSSVTIHPYGRVYYRGKLTKDASVNKPEAQQNFDFKSLIPLHERGWYCNIPKMYNWPSLWGMAICVEHEAWLLQMEGMCVEDAIYMSFLQCMIGSKYRSAQRLAFGVMGEYSDNVFNKFQLFSLAKDMKMAACYNEDNEADYAAIMSNIMYWMFFGLIGILNWITQKSVNYSCQRISTPKMIAS